MGTTQAKKLSQPAQYDVEDDDELYQTRMPSSVRRYRTAPPPPAQQEGAQQGRQRTVPSPSGQAEVGNQEHVVSPRRSRAIPPLAPQQETGEQEDPAPRALLIQRRRASLAPQQTNGIASGALDPVKTEELHLKKRLPLSAILIGMVMTIVLVMSVMALSSWWRVYQDDMHYGRPRTFQMDAVVGHNDSPANPTHFIFMNLHRHVEIIEFPGGDASHSRIFTGPILYGDGQDLTPVTGEIRDVNGDGKPDLIVHIQNQQIVFLNEGTTFHPQS